VTRTGPGGVGKTRLALEVAATLDTGSTRRSRRDGGIHFEQGDTNGRTLGAQAGSQAWAKAQTYLNGSAG
jgi:hypothetical protein